MVVRCSGGAYKRREPVGEVFVICEGLKRARTQLIDEQRHTGSLVSAKVDTVLALKSMTAARTFVSTKRVYA